MELNQLASRGRLLVLVLGVTMSGGATPRSQWDLSSSCLLATTACAGDSSIQGFSTDISVNVGETVHFKIKTTASAYHLDIYRMGYYGGDGASLITTVLPTARLPQSQPSCLTNSSTGLVDCGNWTESASWAVPANARSGIYFAKLVRDSGAAGASHVMFVVRDDSSHSAILFQTSDTTWQAYNTYGGNSLYAGGPGSNPSRAYKVSYNRPITTRGTSSIDFVFNAEYPMVRWLEANGFDVTYTTGVDTDRRGALIKNHKIFLSLGHDEYWSAAQRANVQAARDSGVHLAFLSGNEMFWKTRWENSISSPATAYRTLVCYKETHANRVIDPSDPPTWTGTWRDPRFSPPADGGRPENAITGTIFSTNGGDAATLAMTVRAEDGKVRFWRNTSIATMSPGQVVELTQGTLGYEWDSDWTNGFRPAGLTRLSMTVAYLPTTVLLDYGSTYGSGVNVHTLTLYRAPSSALVFGAGTVHWSWGLDANHDNANFGGPADLRMQQAMVNLFADMGAQPATPQAGIVPATQTTDTTAPTISITAPANNSVVPANAIVAITGTAADTGGTVGGVEVSIDGGTTWAPATGGANWSYVMSTQGLTTLPVKARAIDDSGNIGTASTINLTVNGAVSCPCTILPSGSSPMQFVDGNDPTAISVGLKFRSSVAGFISGVRFYKAPANTGTHVGHLWSSSGTSLATVTFTNETASGWQQANFSTPVSIQANTTYVISVYMPKGHYSEDDGMFFGAGIDNGQLHALADGVSGHNGVYIFNSDAFPTQAYAGTYYWIDTVFSTTSGGTSGPPVISGAGATPTANSATVTWTTDTPASSSVAYSTSSTLQNPTTVSDASLVTSHSISLTGLSANTTYYYKITSTNSGGTTTSPSGNPASFITPAVNTPPVISAITAIPGLNGIAIISWTTNTPSSSTVNYGTSSGSLTSTATASGLVTSHRVTLSGLTQGVTYFYQVTSTDASSLSSTAPASPASFLENAISIWSASTVPAVIDSGDASPVSLGVKFRSDTAGSVLGIRFYKTTTNTGTHIGHLWSRTGTLLATVTFTNETASGWQQAYFSNPVSITANTTYVLSYYAPAGHYSGTDTYFNGTTTTNGPLHALADGTDGPNGVYVYNSDSFPTLTWNSANYFVDVIFH